MYEINPAIIASIKDTFTDELYNRNYNYNNYAIDEIFDEWAKRKNGLMELLSKHPNWNPAKMMIQFDSDFSRDIDDYAARSFFYWLGNATNIKDIVTRESSIFYAYRSLYDELIAISTRETYISNTEGIREYLERINKLHESFRFRPGMKITKVVGKICRTYGWDKIMGTEVDRNGELVTFNEFERRYANYCDAICPLKVKRHTCISLNPVDYLLMSNGNSWRSCHYIGHDADEAGEYSSGTISYMLDEHSIVFYTVDAGYNGDHIECERKIQRQIFGYNDYQIMQSRIYPQDHDYNSEELYTDVRQIVQKVIADCLAKPNLWIKGRVTNVTLGRCATCYPDWSYNDTCSMSTLKEKKECDLKSIILGAKPICIHCGERHTVQENINHCDTYHCADCGRAIRNRDDVYYVDDEAYCCHCVTYCEHCEAYVRDACYVDDVGHVCIDCLEEHFTRCDSCGDYHDTENLLYLENYDEYICRRCARLYYTVCGHCENYIRDKEVVYAGPYAYCEYCAEELRGDDDEQEENHEEFPF